MRTGRHQPGRCHAPAVPIGQRRGWRLRFASPLRRLSRRALWVVLVLPLLAQAEPRLTATLDRDTITLGESVTLSLAFEETKPAEVPQLPELPNLRWSFAGQSSQFQFINGRTTSRMIFNYLLTPAQPGDYQIPAMRINLNDLALTTQPLRLKVLKPGDSVATDSNTPTAAFVRLIAPTNAVFVGEVFPVELQLFYQDADDIQMPQFKTDGFVIGKQAGYTRARAQAYGLIYNVVSFKMSLAAARAGVLPLGPAEIQLVLRLPRAAGRRDPFDPLNFFGRNVELKSVTLSTDPVMITVLPLPADNVPPGFSGSVGNFTLEMHASPTNVAVGDPITLRIRIEGRGTLDSIALPPLEEWREFKVYPPTSKVESEDPLGIEGAKTFEVVVAPQNAEVRALPPLRFSFFDPAQRAYRTLTQPATPLLVRPTAQPQNPPTVLAGLNTDTAPPARDIVHIKPRPGVLATARPPLMLRPGFWAWQTLPAMVFLAAFLWRRRQDQLAGDPRRRRERAVQETVRRGIEELRQHAAGGRSEEFHSTLFRLLQEQIGERLDLPASAITEEAVDGLRALGAADTTVAALHELFRRCNEARYAPRSNSQELATLVTEARQCLNAVQQLRREKGPA